MQGSRHWFLIDCGSKHKKAVRDLAHFKVVRHTKGMIFTSVKGDELRHFHYTCKALNLSPKEMPEDQVPTYEEAPCGHHTTNVHAHSGRCKTYATMRQNGQQATDADADAPPAETQPHRNGKAGPVTTVFKLPGLSDVSLQGVIDLMKARRDTALNLATELDSVITALEKSSEVDQQLATLEAERQQYRKALVHFTEGGRNGVN